MRYGHSRWSSLWLVPALSMLAALLLAPVVRWIDDHLRWTLLDVGLEGARQILSALASSLLTFLVFGISILLLAVQIASGQLTPRLIARLFEHRMTRTTVGIFLFAWVYALAALGHIDQRVPQLPVALAMALGLTSVVLFLYLVQAAIRRMRPVVVLADLGDATDDAIVRRYPAAFSRDVSDGGLHLRASSAAKTIVHHGHPGILIALDTDRVLDIAIREHCTIEAVPSVGDLVVPGAEVFRLYGSAAINVDERQLRQSLLLGSERALECDPAFGVRIIVDIACRALSPGINDPTTAVLALDQLERLLRVLGRREIPPGTLRDTTGEVRVVYDAWTWADFVELATAEIRMYGAQSIQVTRRLQAMFADLGMQVPVERRVALQEQAATLRDTVEAAFGGAADRSRALRADAQGLGPSRRIARRTDRASLART